MKHGFLIDMDGVIYRGNQLIPEAVGFINTLREREIPFLFLTNNSQRTRRDVATRLGRMGMAGLTPRQVPSAIWNRRSEVWLSLSVRKSYCPK
ncbi:MAG: hypothetical protein EHM48_00265 [Planctomycetaceae bacterium]|nr:MAG: hypothetical protein EHM48_00265 [Planctomycetaceae bacterium]